MNRKIAFVLPLVILLLPIAALLSPAMATTTTESPTDQQFGASITAAYVAIPGETVTGTINAIGCDVGVYIAPGVTGVTVTATVTNAGKCGVFNDGGSVNVAGSTITNTGNHVNGEFEPNGAQTGIGIYFSKTATGQIQNNVINEYQKGGIVVRTLESVTISGNTVTGLGPFRGIAQNGIEVGFGSGQGATVSNIGNVYGNTVTANIYTQGASKGYVSTGFLVEATGASTGYFTSQLQTSNTAARNQGNVAVIIG